MTTTVSRPFGTPAQPPAAPPALAPARARSRWTTPVRLRVALLLAVVSGLLLAGAGLGGFLTRADAVDAARTEADDLVTVQTARTRLLTADALAATNVLLGADDSTSPVRHYQYAIDEVLLRIAVASRPADDRTVLAPAASQVADYAAQVARARTVKLDNPGSRIGPDAMLFASKALEDGALPRLESVQDASKARLDGDLGSAADARLVVLVAAALALILFALVQVWLARRTRRILNAGLVAGTIAVLVAGAVALGVLQRSASAADAVRTGPTSRAQTAVDVRAGLFRAVSLESRELLSRSARQTEQFERDWTKAAQNAEQKLTELRGELPAGSPAAATLDTALDRVNTYKTVHTAVISKVRSGDKKGAVAVAADPTSAGSAGSFEDVDAFTGALLASQVSQIDAGLADAGGWLRWAGWLCLLAGLGAAAAAWRGVDARLAEYR